MKRIAILIATVFLTFNLQAQEVQTNTDNRAKKIKEFKQERFDKLSETLNLTPDQQAQLKEIRSETRESMKDRNAQNVEFRQNLRAKAENDIRNVLDNDQRAKYDEVMAERKANRQEMRVKRDGNHKGCQKGQKACCKKGGAKAGCSKSQGGNMPQSK